MALTNYERQKRWREKNRSIYNLRRRKARKDLRGYTESTVCTGQPEQENDRPTVPATVVEIPTLSTIDKLRQLIAAASAAPNEPEVKLLVYRDDYGRKITEGQWNTMQARKQEAKDGGYEIDEFTQ